MKLPILPKNVKLRKEPAVIKPLWESLAPREQEVAALLVKGYTHARISKQLGIAKSTVKKYVISIKEKWGLKGPAAVAIRASYEKLEKTSR